MRAKQNIFQKIRQKLVENVMSSIVSDLKETGMQYCHVKISVPESRCFFARSDFEYPFNVANMDVIHSSENDEESFRFVLFNLSDNGQISISENLRWNNTGTVALGNTVIIFNDFNLFNHDLRIENYFLLRLTRELMKCSIEIKTDLMNLHKLLNDMDKINPKITREVLFEKI